MKNDKWKMVVLEGRASKGFCIFHSPFFPSHYLPLLLALDGLLRISAKRGQSLDSCGNAATAFCLPGI
jgi:hypothetical protein